VADDSPSFWRSALKFAILLAVWIGLIVVLAVLQSHSVSLAVGGVGVASAIVIGVALVLGRLTDALADALSNRTPHAVLVPLDSVLGAKLDETRFVNVKVARLRYPGQADRSAQISGLFGVLRVKAKGGRLVDCKAELRISAAIPTVDIRTGERGTDDRWAAGGSLPWYTPGKLRQALSEGELNLHQLGLVIENPRETLHPGTPQTLVLCFLGHDQPLPILCGNALGSAPMFNPGESSSFLAEVTISASNSPPEKHWFTVTCSRNSITIRHAPKPDY
jgi:hypothetical protein